MRTLSLILLTVMTLLAGCRSTAPTSQADTQQYLVFEADQYRSAYEAAVQVLRDQGFVIARRDYRFGVITTEAKESPTAVEWWIDDATTRSQAHSDTLNAQQRSVTVRFTKSPQIEDAHEMRVEVLVQRLQRPDRFLTHSATGQITATYAATPTHLSERGIDGPYVQTLARDTHLQRRLTQAIHDAIGE